MKFDYKILHLTVKITNRVVPMSNQLSNKFLKFIISLILSQFSFLVFANTVSELSALEKHVLAFSEKREDAKIIYSDNSIGTELTELGSPNAMTKGRVIHKFNAANSGKCPFSRTEFNSGADGTFGYTLHLGSARVWDPDGSINEDKFAALIEATKEFNFELNEFIVKRNKVMEYLEYRRDIDPEVPETGRYASKIPFSREIQYKAATGAWGEVFESIKSGVDNDEPYVTVTRLELFFRDTPAVLREIKKI